MTPIAKFLLIVAGAELLVQIAFLLLKWVTVVKGGKGLFNRFWFEVVRGILERFVLTIGILSGFPQVLIPFGVLKLQNRIGFERDSKAETKEDARAYFLIGNLLTILISIVYVLIAGHGFGISLRLPQD